MQNFKTKFKGKLPQHEKNPKPADDDQDDDSVDEDTSGSLQREAEAAEKDGHWQGKPGSFLNKLIMSGNKKTEDQIARESALSDQNSKSKSK